MDTHRCMECGGPFATLARIVKKRDGRVSVTGWEHESCRAERLRLAARRRQAKTAKAWERAGQIKLFD